MTYSNHKFIGAGRQPQITWKEWLLLLLFLLIYGLVGKMEFESLKKMEEKRYWCCAELTPYKPDELKVIQPIKEI